MTSGWRWRAERPVGIAVEVAESGDSTSDARLVASRLLMAASARSAAAPLKLYRSRTVIRGYFCARQLPEAREPSLNA